MVYGYVESPAEVRREFCRGMVHATCPPVARVACVLDAYALPVVMPVARVPGYVLVAHALGDVPPAAHDVVGGDLGLGALEPAYGARVGALRYMDDYEVYRWDPSVGVGVVAAVGRPPDRPRIVGPALG